RPGPGARALRLADGDLRVRLRPNRDRPPLRLVARAVADRVGAAVRMGVRSLRGRMAPQGDRLRQAPGTLCPLSATPMPTDPRLVVDGAVANPVRLGFDDLAALPDQIPDVSAHHPGREGQGVDLTALLRLTGPRPEARFLTLHADRDDFHVSIPLE